MAEKKCLGSSYGKKISIPNVPTVTGKVCSPQKYESDTECTWKICTESGE